MNTMMNDYELAAVAGGADTLEYYAGDYDLPIQITHIPLTGLDFTEPNQFQLLPGRLEPVPEDRIDWKKIHIDPEIRVTVMC